MEDNTKKDQKVIMGGFRGNLYQVKLLMLFFYRGLSLNYEYELGTEIDEAEKFDDLVFKYVNKSDEKEHFIMIQAKHKMEKTNKIKITDLLTVNDVNFGLVKYYNSFRKAKNNDLFKNGVIDYVIVYTNNEFDTETNKILKNDIKEVDLVQESMLCLCKIDNDGKFYKFKSELLLKKLMPLIKSYLCEYNKIAERLVDFLLKKKTFLHSDDLFKNYHYLLANEVIDVEKKNFRKEFIDGQESDSDGLKHFRKVLIEVLKANEKDLESVKESKFILSNKFGKTDDVQLWPEEKIEISDRDVEEFSEKFVFLTNQPNGINLDRMMEYELRDKYFFDDHLYNTLFKEITIWTAGKPFESSISVVDERFISSKDAREFLTRINRKKNEVISKMTTDEYMKVISKFNVYFDDKIMNKNLEEFLDSKSKILSICSDYIKLTSIKVYQTFESLIEKRGKTACNDLIYVRSNNLIESSIGHFAIRSFESILFDNSLLVIECDMDQKNFENNESLIAIKICDILKNSRNKKIIIISSENNNFSKELKIKSEEAIKFEEKMDQISFVDDLSNDSQKAILEKYKISFQGRDTNLKDIINEKSILIDEKVLTKIVNDEKIRLGKEYEGPQEIKKYYVSRKLLFELYLDDSKILLITGFDEIDFTTLSNNAFFKRYSVDLNPSDEKNALESDQTAYYDLMCENIDNEICLLRKDDESINFLRKNKRFTLKSNEVKKVIGETFESEIVLLTAVPGMGKTSIFARWCELIKNNNPDLWVYKIDLINLSKTLKEIRENVEKSDDENLMCFMTVALGLETEFEINVFKNYLIEGKLVLFFDGFDEVSQYKKEVIQLVQTINRMSKINKLFISSRPYEDLLSAIKNNFNVATCKLQPFTKYDQFEFLKKFWNVDVNSFPENSLEIFIETLLTDLRKKINDNGMEFSSIALHLYMIGVTFKNRFENFNESNFNETHDHHIRNTEKISKISELYKNFIRTKCYDIFYDGKMKLERAVKGISKMAECYFINFIEKNKLLALNSMFTDDQIRSLLSQTNLDQLEKYKAEIEDSGEDIGIVVHIVDKKPFFVHKTFAEYFIADFFIGTFIDENAPEKLTAISFFLNNVLDETNSTMCNFFNDMSNDEINEKIEKIGIKDTVKSLNVKKLDLAISRKWKFIMKLLLNNDINVLSTSEKNGSILHSAIYLYNNISPEIDDEIFSLLIEKLSNKPETLKKLLKVEDFMGYTPFFDAVGHGNLKTVKILFEIMSNLNVLNLNEKNGTFGDNLLHAATKNLSGDVFEFISSKISEDSLSAKKCFLGTNRSKNTPLISALESGLNDVVETLIKQYDNLNMLREVIKIKNIDDDNIFHITARGANENLMPILVEGLRKYSDELKELLLEKNLDGDTSLMILVIYKKFDDVEFLIKTFEELKIMENALIQRNFDKENVLHLAAKNENDCLNFFLKHLKNYPEIFKKLFETENEFDENPLYYAATMDNVENMKLLIEKIREFGIFETAVVVKNVNNYNILHVTARKDTDTLQYFLKEMETNPDILKKLLRHRENCGSTPLLLAIYFDCINNVKSLIETVRSLDMLEEALGLENYSKSNLLHFAVMKKNTACLEYVSEELKKYPELFKKLITSNNSEQFTPLLVATYFTSIKNVKYLVELCKGFKILEEAIDTQDTDSNNFLHLASNTKNDDCLRFLLEEMKNFPSILTKTLESKNSEGLTPIFFIVQYGHMKIFTELIEICRKLDILKNVIFAENNEDENILHLTAKMENDDFLQSILETLKNDKEILKSMLCKANKNGETPLILAEKHNYTIIF